MNNSKRKFGQTALIVASFLPGLLLLALPLYTPGELPVLLLFLGRFHPLILHFPIVLIILALLFELARRFHLLKSGDNILTAVLILAAVSTLVSIAAGFLLFASGDYSGKLMEQHFWAGSFTGAAIFTTLVFFFLHRRNPRLYPIYLVCLLISNASVGYASHLGGSITHGEDYLTEYVPMITSTEVTEEVRPESDMLVYQDMIAPIFEAKCLSCHNEVRAKGRLLMTSYQNLLKGGESGHPAVSVTLPDSSELLKRVILPEEHKDHMPPEGKSPLSEKEIALVKFWIGSGAVEKLKVAEARTQEKIRPVVENILPELVKYRRKRVMANMKLKDVEEELAVLAQKLGVLIQRDSAAEGNLFSIAMKFPPAPFTNDQFRELAPYDEFFSKLSLVSSGIDDDGLYYIGHMVNLRELYVQKTVIEGPGLLYLQKMPNLEVLNLSFTKVDDKSAIDLLKFPKLKKVYLYRSGTSGEVAEALTKYKPGLEVILEEGPYF